MNLIATNIAYGEAAYPSESNHHLDAAAHTDNAVELFAAWEGTCCFGMLGMMKMSDTSAEIKSMHVLEAGRGRGVGAVWARHCWIMWWPKPEQQALPHCFLKQAVAMPPLRRGAFMNGQALFIVRHSVTMPLTPKVSS
tara:strand:+ start:1958 stop:2371 length:414 start_codon:yes stop_codon:yes gene_type:complete